MMLIPAASVLRAADRQDLLSEIQRFGGAIALAPQIGMTTQRGAGFASFKSAVRQLLCFVQQLHEGSSQPRQSWHMPTQQQLRKARRYDLLTAISKYGQQSLAEAARLQRNHRGQRRSQAAS